jgi:hypothetical protein
MPYKMRGISRLAEDSLVSKEGLCFMELDCSLPDVLRLFHETFRRKVAIE